MGSFWIIAICCTCGCPSKHFGSCSWSRTEWYRQCWACLIIPLSANCISCQWASRWNSKVLFIICNALHGMGLYYLRNHLYPMIFANLVKMGKNLLIKQYPLSGSRKCPFSIVVEPCFPKYVWLSSWWPSRSSLKTWLFSQVLGYSGCGGLLVVFHDI